jgi:lipopolysaccharide export system protein LptA
VKYGTEFCGVFGVAAVLSLLVLSSGTAYAAAVDEKATGRGVVSTNQVVHAGERDDGLVKTNSTVITSDKLTFDYEKGYGDLEDNVHVVSSEMSIDADRIVLKFQENNQITNLVATGHVSIKQGDGFATCSTARCDVATGEVVLTGNPVLRRGQEVMKGDIITIVREPGKKSVRVKCVGSPGSPTSLILGPGAKIDDMRLSGE